MIGELDPRVRTHKSPEFLRFAKSLGGECCVCRYCDGVQTRAVELHHFGEKGMGQRANDHFVGRVCIEHHHQIQGKRRIAFIRMDRIDILEALEADALDLLTQWTQRLEEKRPPGERCYRCSTCDYHTGDSCMATLDHVEPPLSCAREEALEKALEWAPDTVDEFMEWAIAWSNKRSANVLGDLAETLREVAENKHDAGASAFIAIAALKRARLDSVSEHER